MRCIIAFAGASKSGKTSLAKELAEKLAFRFVSFGDFVRRQATRSGLTNPSQAQLQDIGQQLVTTNLEGFCKAVLDLAGVKPGEPLVIDGVRHLQVLTTLRLLLPDQPLKVVYLVRNPDERAQDSGLDAACLNRVDSHPVEAQAGALQSVADLVVNTSTSERDVCLTRVVDWVLRHCENAS